MDLSAMVDGREKKISGGYFAAGTWFPELWEISA
jgi:hypothetical protein